MDFPGAIQAGWNFFSTNWTVIEGLARNLAADLAAVWALGVGLSLVLKPFFPKFGQKLQDKTLSVVGLAYDDD